MNNMELLAPAGNFECLVAAVQSGADAVYLSGKLFGARSFADNFSLEEIEKAVDYCHIRSARVYVTVNTLILDTEFEELCDYLRFLNRIGVDGIIVQDLGIVQVAAQIVPDLPIHASTQMTVMNSAGVRTLEKMGIKRVVLAREVSLDDIKEISKNTTAELEIFAHGALCMSYSGQCLMSSIIGGRSGNRGKCAQPCRLPYSVNGKSKKAFYMSLKDLAALEHIEELRMAGIASLKIEGRMKGPAYVAAVVGVYRKYIDNPHPVEEKDIELLDMIFNRGGLTDGYLTGNKGTNMFALDKPDNPYRKGSDELVSTILKSIKTENRKLILDCEIEIRKEAKPEIIVKTKCFKTAYQGEKLTETAKQNPLTVEGVKAQLSKTGGTPFEFSNISVRLDDDVFLSASEINKLRRNVLELFEKEYLQSFRRMDEDVLYVAKLSNLSEITKSGYVCEVTTFEQFYALKEFPYDLFYIPLHLLEENAEYFRDYKEKIVIVPPSIIGENEQRDVFEKIDKLLSAGFYAVLAMNIALVERFKKYRIIAGLRLNIFNSYALEFCKKCQAIYAELSPELSLRQIRELKKSLPVQAMVYGRLPIMMTENCVIKNGAGCPCKGNGTITDRLGMKFPVIKDGNLCRNIILNCKKTFMAFDMEKIKNAGVNFFRLYFTDEEPEECVKISESFLSNTGYRPEDFTSGHFVKGVQ